MAEKFFNLAKETDIQVQESQSSKQDKAKRLTPRHTVIKMVKVKDKETILKAERIKQQVIYKGSFKWLQADFSGAIL